MLLCLIFRDKPVDSGKILNGTDKVRLSDVILPASKCTSKFTILTYLYMLPLLMFAIFRLIKVFNVVYHYADIKAFYNVVLHIPDVRFYVDHAYCYNNIYIINSSS